jgi:DedD protein
MERKKLLLVAVSVGVFLVIVISAGILIFTPKASVSGTAVSSARPISAGTGSSVYTREAEPQRNQPASLDAAELVRNSGDVQGIQTPPQATAIQETSFYINGERPLESYTVEKNEGDSSAKVIINVPKPSTAAVPDTHVEAPASRAAPAAAPTATAVRPVAPAAKPAAAAVKPAAAKAPVQAAKAASPAKTYNDYWVQTGAFSAMVRAEGVKETLASKGITSIIENREVDGKTWYRVRVGPYTSETEASYWLALVKAIDGFGDSQIRQTRSVR